METSNIEHGGGNLMQKAKYLRQVTQCLTMEMNCKARGDEVYVVQWKRIVEGWTMEINCKAQVTGDKLQKEIMQ